jgi:hypothetical protein
VICNYRTPRIIKIVKLKWLCCTEHVNRKGWKGYVYRILVEKSLGKCRMRWEDDKRKDLNEMYYEVGKSLHLAQNRVQFKALMSTIFDYRVLLL